MKNNAEELIKIIKKGVEISLLQDDEQFVKNAIIQANKFAEEFSEKDWKSLMTKLPVEKSRSCKYDKIKEPSIKIVIKNEDNSTAQMINDIIFDIIIKNAPDGIKTLATERLKNKKNK